LAFLKSSLMSCSIKVAGCLLEALHFDECMYVLCTYQVACRLTHVPAGTHIKIVQLL